MRRALLAAVAGLALAAPSAQAAQLTVSTTADAPGVCVDGACPTLRAALETAAGTAETDTIQLPGRRLRAAARRADRSGRRDDHRRERAHHDRGATAPY